MLGEREKDGTVKGVRINRFEVPREDRIVRVRTEGRPSRKIGDSCPEWEAYS